ncbi:MAG TPA: sigma-70 family RNA polymerase sigma factor [Chitinophagaceae bacterium]|nr:sigma-70 family RNA polymerase sigma factor [Chitinophagaceae bacterium]
MSETTASYHPSETELLQLIAQGDTVAFRRLFDRYRDPVFTFAMHYTHRQDAAEEIVQETFLKLWLLREKLPLVERFEAWLFVVTRNFSYSYLRKLAREAALLQQWGASQVQDVETPDEWLLSKEYAQLLERAIDQLSPQQKQVYTLYRNSRLRQEDIARELGLALSTVKTHLSLAKRSITVYLDSHIELALFVGLLAAIP